MNFISSLIYAAAALVGFGFWMYQNSDYQRYDMHNMGNSVLIFDKKNGFLYVCNEKESYMIPSYIKNSSFNHQMMPPQQMMPPMGPQIGSKSTAKKPAEDDE
jgi:hypothetical protein